MPNAEANRPTPGAAPPDRPWRRAARLAGQAAALLRARAAESWRESKDALRAALRWTWARRPPARRAAAILWCALAALLGAWSVLAQSSLAARLPAPIDWAAAATLVERDARPGDAVALSPPWAERAREALPASVAVLAHHRYAGEDLVGVRRIWLLSVRRAPGYSGNVEVDLLDRASSSNPPESLGAIHAIRYDLAFPTLPFAFFPDRLSQADVSIGGEPCVRSGDAFECRGAVPVRVERAVREVGGEPRACIVATLGASGPPLVLAFPSVRIGRVVHGHAAPAGAARPAGTIRVSVQLDGEEAGAAETADGWRPFQIDTTRFAGQIRTLSMVVTPSGPGAVCLDAMTLP